MKYLKFSNGGVVTDVTAENIKSSSSDARTIADKLNISEISTAADLNDYVNQGLFYFSVAPTNIPAGTTGWLLVLTASGFVKQIWMRSAQNNTNHFNTFIREYYESTSTWSDWKRIAVASSNGSVETSNGGTIGYAGLVTNLNNAYTQGQYHVQSGTNLPAGASANGILTVYVGNGGVEGSSGAGAWCTQVYYSNNGRVYSRCRTSLSGAWTAWKLLTAGHDDKEVTLSSLTWHSTSAGMYYSDDIAPDTAFSEIDNVCIATWSSFSAELIVQPYISGNKIALMANKNTFGSAKITVRITGTFA